MSYSPLKKFLLVSTLLAITASAPVFATETQTTVVLVHGALANSSSWDKVIPLLQAKGLKVVAVQIPLTSLADDVAVTKRAIDAQTGQVVLVGHSWGGTVITQAGDVPKVKALVYVAAFAPSEGEATADLGKAFPAAPGAATFKADTDGFLTLPEASMQNNFAPDLPAAQARLMAVTQGPIQSKAFGEPVTVAAWRTKPDYFIVSAQDRMIQPALERAMGKKINATISVLQASHAVMLSHPKEVAEVIIQASKVH